MLSFCPWNNLKSMGVGLNLALLKDNQCGDPSFIDFKYVILILRKDKYIVGRIG